MKFFLLLLLSGCCICSLSAQPITCNCTASTQLANQQRSDAKHATDYAAFVVKPDTIDLDYVYTWQATYTPITDTLKTRPFIARVKLSPEDTLYTLKGYMWFVKQEGNDCDFHIEIGPEDIAGTRFVVEVPQENSDLQDKIRKQLGDLGLNIMGCNTSSTANAHFKKGIPVVVTGLGFYDASHKPNTNHGDAHTKIYSWELHPVQDIEFVQE